MTVVSGVDTGLGSLLGWPKNAQHVERVQMRRCLMLVTAVLLILLVTAGPSVAAMSLNFSNVKGDSVTLNWSQVSLPSSLFTEYRIWRSTGSPLGMTIVHTESNVATTSWTDTGLSSQTTYNYKVEAVNNTGSVVDSATGSVTTSIQWPGGISPSGWCFIFGVIFLVVTIIFGLPFGVHVEGRGVKYTGSATVLFFLVGVALMISGL